MLQAIAVHRWFVSLKRQRMRDEKMLVVACGLAACWRAPRETGTREYLSEARGRGGRGQRRRPSLALKVSRVVLIWTFLPALVSARL